MHCLVFGMSADKLGGIETFLINMNKHMKDCVFDYVVYGDSCIHEEAAERNSSRIIYVKSYHDALWRSIVDMIRIIKACRKTHQVAYFNLFSMVHMLPVVLCRIFGYRIVFHAHSTKVPNTSKLYRFLHNTCRFVFGGMRSCKRLTCAPLAAEFMFGKGKNRSAKMIYNAVDLERFSFDQVERENVRKKLGVNDECVIGFVGRLAKQKNPFFMIDIFEAYHRKQPKSLLVVVGDGEYRGELERRIGEKGMTESVRMLGQVREIEKVYAAMDIFVLPSLFEGLPISLVEAQATGLPCFVSSASPKETVIEDGNVSFISLQLSAEEWANIIPVSLEERKAWAGDASLSKFNLSCSAKYLEEELKSMLMK